MAELQFTNDIQPSIQGESVNQHILDEILQKLDNLSNIPQQIEDMNKSLSSDISELVDSIQFSQKQTEDMSKLQSEQSKLIATLKAELSIERSERCQLQRELKQLQDRMVASEIYLLWSDTSTH